MMLIKPAAQDWLAINGSAAAATNRILLVLSIISLTPSRLWFRIAVADLSRPSFRHCLLAVPEKLLGEAR
ncbi:hypothetical protein, partial [Mesorhizobium sp.]|uniref:hypothetical protein n=1 Tax=Mesorhizobium sp. TaxID=1871066 RepID=UPI0025C0A79D